MLLVISSRYANTKDLCVWRRASPSAEFLSGSRPHSLRLYSPTPTSSLCAVFLPQGSSSKRRSFHLMVSHYWPADLAPQDPRLLPLALSAWLPRAVSRWTSFVESPQNPVADQDVRQIRNGAFSRTFEVKTRLAVNCWRVENSWQMLGCFFHSTFPEEVVFAELTSQSRRLYLLYLRNAQTLPEGMMRLAHSCGKTLQFLLYGVKKYSVLNERVPPNMKLNLTVGNLPKGSELCKKKSPKTFVPSFLLHFF